MNNTNDNAHDLTYYRILLVEDDLRLSALVVEYLHKNGFHVETEYRGDTAVKRILDYQPDLVVLDLMLPGLDGLEVCKKVRPIYSGPIIMLTAKDDEIDQVVGLEIGADDYVVKPAQPRLLLARIRALLRRASIINENNLEKNETNIQFDSLCISKSSRTVSRNGENIELTTTEFDLLWLLASQAGKILSRDAISEALTGIEYDGLDRSIDIRISRLRKLLHDDANKPKGIKTVRGKGYLFVPNGWSEGN